MEIKIDNALIYIERLDVQDKYGSKFTYSKYFANSDTV